MSGIDDAQRLLSAASDTSDYSRRILYAAEARLHLARELDRLADLQRHLEAIEGEIVRIASMKRKEIDK